jgi:hypothetical protein
MNNIKIGSLYKCSVPRELWKDAEKMLPSAASSKVLVGHLKDNTPFVVLEQRTPRTINAAFFKDYRDLKILAADGYIAWIYCYLSDLEQLSG